MNVTPLAAAGAQIIGRSTLAGFGLSLGCRIERNFWAFVGSAILWAIPMMIGLGGFVLPFTAARRMTRWHPATGLSWVFRIVLTWIVLGAVGLAILYGVMFFLVLLVADGKWPEAQIKSAAHDITWIVGTTSVLLGAVAGLCERRRRKASYQVLVDNQAFLDKHGLREIDGASVTHVDGQGNRLKLEHTGQDIIEFAVVGSRRGRAYITIGKDGRYLEYSRPPEN